MHRLTHIVSLGTVSGCLTYRVTSSALSYTRMPICLPLRRSYSYRYVLMSPEPASAELFGVRLRVESDVGLAEAGRLWPLTAHLARFVAAEFPPPHGLSGLHTLELGAGTAALSCALALAYPHAAVVATDLPVVLPLMQRNVALNGLSGRVVVAPLPWGDRNALACLFSSGTADVVLCCECLYWGGWTLLEEDTRELLRSSLLTVCNQHTRCVLGFTVRDAGRELGFVRRLVEQDGFHARCVCCSGLRWARVLTPASALRRIARYGRRQSRTTLF